MAPKYRGSSSTHLRSHSRTSSATKLGTNLQFTQHPAQAKPAGEKGKKTGVVHEPQSRASQLPRVTSAPRISSKDQLPPLIPQQKRAPTPSALRPGGKQKAGFTIASPSEADDDDDWVSSESGAATPNHHDSDDPDSNPATPVEQKPNPIINNNVTVNSKAQLSPAVAPVLARVSTLRPSDYDSPKAATNVNGTSAAPPQPSSALSFQSPAQQQPPPIQTGVDQLRPMQTTYQSQKHFRHSSEVTPLSSGMTSPKRHTRPPSMHSLTGRSDHQNPLRPHPLIRGQSYGQPTATLSKPAPLAPLTASDAASVTPPRLQNGVKGQASPPLSSSPSSPRPLSFVAPSPTTSANRRTSVSSARSVATLPVPVTATFSKEPRSFYDRTRTLSTMSSSSAALSSLAHLPAVSRPPTPQLISFFPPTNPHANLDEIHSLLPRPYLMSHLTTLAHRTPLRESYDRVMKAKTGR